MKTYKKYIRADAPITYFDTELNWWFPETEGNALYTRMLEEVAAEEATVEDVEVTPDPPPPIPRISTKLFTSPIQITEDTNWQSLGGVAVNVQFYVSDLSKAAAIVELNAKASGTGAELRLVEIDADENVRVMSDSLAIGASTKWAILKLESDEVPSEGDQTYELQGRLNGANSASVRYGAIVLLENP